MNFDPSWIKYDIFSIIQKPTKTIIIMQKLHLQLCPFSSLNQSKAPNFFSKVRPKTVFFFSEVVFSFLLTLLLTKAANYTNACPNQILFIFFP